MRRILLLFFAISSFAQQNNSFDFTVLNSALMAPTINLDTNRAVFAANDDQLSLYLQGALDIGVDAMYVGGSIDKSLTERNYTVNVGKIVDNFRATLAVGFLDSFDGYTGTFAGFSFAWQPQANDYVGLQIGNLHSVSMDVDNDLAFDYYKKLTPKLYASYEIIEHLIVYGQLSSRLNDIALKYENDRFGVGGYYSDEGNQGVFGTLRIGRFYLLCSSNFEKINLGLKFQ